MRYGLAPILVMIAAIATLASAACESGHAASPSSVVAATNPTDPPRDENERPGTGDDASIDVATSDAGTADADAAASAPPPCLPNNTKLAVTAIHDDAYIIDGKEDPTLVLCRGRTYVFELNAKLHPFLVKLAPTEGAADRYDVGVTNNGYEVGTITFVVPMNAPSSLWYVCEYHPGMIGELRIRD
jgi:hypothetical protein